MNFNATNPDNMTQLGGSGADTLHGREGASFPLGTGDDGLDADSAFDPLAGAESVKRSNTGTVLIILVILVAAGGLFSMRTLAKVSASVQSDTEVESSIETFIATLTGSSGGKSSGTSVLLRDDDPSLEVLSESYTEHQVPLVNVAKNPFLLAQKSTDLATNPVVDTGGSDRIYEQRRRQKIKDIESAKGRLTLTSVLLGSTPLANINGKILRVGNTITMEREDVTFTLLGVESDAVTLITEDVALDLSYEVTIRIDRDLEP